jgi:hypothetical protein
VFSGVAGVGGAAFYRRLALTVLVTLVVILGTLGALAIHRHTRGSPSLHVLGRDYARSKGMETLGQIRAGAGPAPIIVNDPHFVDHPAYPKNEQPVDVYVKHGSVYWEYVLEGGP